MRVLVLGASGMLGHKLVQVMGAELETVAAVRKAGSLPDGLGASAVVDGVEAGDLASVVGVLDRVQPDAVLNAVGVIKQALPGHASTTISVNALFPNQLAELCSARAIRLVHYSTDCVFSGARDSQRGRQGYRETDLTDARDLYGLSKRLGEPEGGAHLTLRTSMIGRELRGRMSLLEWFLAQPDPAVRGFTQALFSGLTTLELARVTLRLLKDHSRLTGLWHVAGEPISKHDLLGLVRRAYGVSADIFADDSVYCDRRLDGSRFSQATGWQPPGWPALIAELQQDSAAYEYSRAERQSVLSGG